MNIILILFMVATLGVLLLGLASMIKGGEWNRKYGNKLMIVRVSMQAATIALLGLLILFGGHK